MNNLFDASIILTTKNRKDDLRNAISSSLSQRGNIEVIVIDDGSTDGTSDMVQSEFPSVKFIRSESSEGYIKQRNSGAKLASSPVIISIDDDAIFSTPDVVTQTLKAFDDLRIGAIAMPYINVKQDDIVRQLASSDQGIFIIDSYIGTAHAIRRDIFLRLGGYRAQLIHQGEESDFCLRMLNSGYVVRLGNSDPIHHFESPRRDMRRMHYYGSRNSVLYAWHNVPFPFLFIHLAATIIKGLIFAMRIHAFRIKCKAFLDGLMECRREWNNRAPVKRRIYLLARRIRKQPGCSLRDIESILPTCS